MERWRKRALTRSETIDPEATSNAGGDNMTEASSQVWFVTGSSRGLGRALTEAVLAAGHRVVATARKTADLNRFADHHGDRVMTVALDVTQPEQALRAVKEAVGVFGRIDVLVNNAGYA